LGRGDEGRGETFEHGQLSSSFGSFSGSKAPCLWPVVPQFFRHILVGLCLHVSKVGSAPGADPKHGMHSSSVLTFSQTWHFFGSFGACWGFSSSPRFPVGFPVGSMAQRVHARSRSHTEKACAPVVNPQHICWGSWFWSGRPWRVQLLLIADLFHTSDSKMGRVRVRTGL